MLDEDRSYCLRPSTNLSSSISQEKSKSMGPKKVKPSSGNQPTVRDEISPQRPPSGSPQQTTPESTSWNAHPKSENAKPDNHVTAQPANASASPVHTKPSSGQSSELLEIKEMIANLSKAMNSRFDNMKLEMHMMRVELTETRKIMQDLEHSVSFNSDKIKELEKEVLPKMMDDMIEKNNQLEEKLLLLELHDRKQNLLMYGVQEMKNENVYNTVQGVIAHFLQIPPIDAMKIPLVNAHRLPVPHHHSDRRASPPAPRPIIIRFGLMADRNRLLESFENHNRQRSVSPDQQQPQDTQPPNDLSSNQHASDPPMQASSLSQPSQNPQAPIQPFAYNYDRVSIRTDLPPSMKRERGRLASIAFKIRKDDNLSTRIRQNGTKLYLQTRKKVAIGSPKSQWINWKEGP